MSHVKQYIPTQNEKVILKYIETQALETLKKCNIKPMKAQLMVHSGVSTLGHCLWRSSGRVAIVSLSRQYMKYGLNGHEDELINTMIHEYLHVYCHQQNYHCGHTGPWKEYAALVSRKTKYKISRLASTDLRTTQKYRYELVCQTCGTTTKYMKAGKYVRFMQQKQGDRMRCCQCGDSNFKLITHF